MVAPKKIFAKKQIEAIERSWKDVEDLQRYGEGQRILLTHAIPSQTQNESGLEGADPARSDGDGRNRKGEGGSDEDLVGAQIQIGGCEEEDVVVEIVASPDRQRKEKKDQKALSGQVGSDFFQQQESQGSRFWKGDLFYKLDKKVVVKEKIKKTSNQRQDREGPSEGPISWHNGKSAKEDHGAEDEYIEESLDKKERGRVFGVVAILFLHIVDFGEIPEFGGGEDIEKKSEHVGFDARDKAMAKAAEVVPAIRDHQIAEKDR